MLSANAIAAAPAMICAFILTSPIPAIGMLAKLLPGGGRCTEGLGPSAPLEERARPVHRPPSCCTATWLVKGMKEARAGHGTYASGRIVNLRLGHARNLRS